MKISIVKFVTNETALVPSNISDSSDERNVITKTLSNRRKPMKENFLNAQTFFRLNFGISLLLH